MTVCDLFVIIVQISKFLISRGFYYLGLMGLGFSSSLPN